MSARSGILLLAAACAVVLGCSSGPIDARVQIAGPIDSSCLGVVGFEVEVAANEVRKHTQILKAPVLDPAECRLDSVSVVGIEVDVPITVTVDGYDSKGTPVVHVKAPIGELRAPTTHSLALSSVRNAGAVLVVDRSALLATGALLSDVTAMEIQSSPPKQSTIVKCTITDELRPFFQAGEPGAFVLDESVAIEDGQKVSVAFTMANGAVQQSQDKLQLTRDGGEGIWRVQPTK